MAEYFLALASKLRSPENWLTTPGAVAISLILALATGSLFYFLTGQPTQDLTAIQRLWTLMPSALAFLAALLASLVAWFLVREAYYRSGKGRVVAVCFDSHKADPDDYVLAKRLFHQHFEEGRLPIPVTLKLLPRSLAINGTRRKKLLKRWGITTLYHITVIQSIKPPRLPHYRVEWTTSDLDSFDEKFREATLAHMRALGTREVRDPVHSTRDLLQHASEAIFDILLLAMAVSDFGTNEFGRASQFLAILEVRVSNRFGTTQNPRAAIRWLDNLCLLGTSQFPGSDPPGPDELQAALRLSERAVEKYGDQFPSAPLVHARTQFYLGDLDGALVTTRRGLKFAENDLARAYFELNVFVLQLFNSNWKEAARALERFFNCNQSRAFNWPDLIGFADCASDMGYEAAIYTRALYRQIHDRRGVDPHILAEAAEWMNSDPSKSHLRGLFKSAPSLQASDQKKLRSPRQQKKIDKKQRYKRRKQKR